MRIEKANYLNNYNIELSFSDGKTKVFDFLPEIERLKNMKKLEDLEYFKLFSLDDGVLCWPNGLDFCPGYLYDPVEFNKSFDISSPK